VHTSCFRPTHFRDVVPIWILVVALLTFQRQNGDAQQSELAALNQQASRLYSSGKSRRPFRLPKRRPPALNADLSTRPARMTR
jgi:hypothetical protein